MGTWATVAVRGPDANLVVDNAFLRLAELEARWSRFIPDSDVSRLNAAAGSPVRVCPETIRLVSCAIDGWRRTDGDFDPTVITHMIRAGYDRTFSAIEAATKAPISHDRDGKDATEESLIDADVRCDGITVDIDGSTVALPRGTGFDPGGIGKGLAADIVAEEAIAFGATGVCVNLGGDIRVAHAGSAHGSWPIEIRVSTESTGRVIGNDSLAPADPSQSLAVRNGGIATSSPAVRRWEVDGVSHHHLIDPRTGRSLDTPIALVTVIAASSWQADVLTKAVFVRGAAHGCALVADIGAAARVVMIDGSTITTDSWVQFRR